MIRCQGLLFTGIHGRDCSRWRWTGRDLVRQLTYVVDSILNARLKRIIRVLSDPVSWELTGLVNHRLTTHNDGDPICTPVRRGQRTFIVQGAKRFTLVPPGLA